MTARRYRQVQSNSILFLTERTRFGRFEPQSRNHLPRPPPRIPRHPLSSAPSRVVGDRADDDERSDRHIAKKISKIDFLTPHLFFIW
jgi:hypothetical protein